MELSSLYSTRLDAWRINHFTGDQLGDISLKFDAAGRVKPFYGLTIVAFVDPETPLHRKLCDYQQDLRSALTSAGLDAMFCFLDPLSFHMTLCDIVAAPIPIPKQDIQDISDVARACFPRLGMDVELSCELSGLGLDMSMMVLAGFKTAAALTRCLKLEKQLKVDFGVDQRAFLGHISLAYLVKQPTSLLEHMKAALAPFREKYLEAFAFHKISLCLFSDMNHYTPLVEVDIRTGELLSVGSDDTQ